MSPVGRSTAQVAGRVGDLFGPFRSDPAQQESALSPQALVGPRPPIGSAFRELTAGLIGKAQRMHDSRQFTVAEIATSCGVTPIPSSARSRASWTRPGRQDLPGQGCVGSRGSRSSSLMTGTG